MDMYNKFEEVLRRLSEGNVEPLYNQIKLLVNKKIIGEK